LGERLVAGITGNGLSHIKRWHERCRRAISLDNKLRIAPIPAIADNQHYRPLT
jgi:hypothetical protein